MQYNTCCNKLLKIVRIPLYIVVYIAALFDAPFLLNSYQCPKLFAVTFQMRLAASSCVMIGVQGAGLQWSVFMPDGCTVIEIAWPSRHWGFHFGDYVNPYGIVHYSLRATAHVNWDAYERNVRGGKKVK